MKLKVLVLSVFLSSLLQADQGSVDCKAKGSLLVLYKLKAMLSFEMHKLGMKRSAALSCDLLAPKEYSLLSRKKEEGIKRCLAGASEDAFGGGITSQTPLEEAIKKIHISSGDDLCFSDFMSSELARIARKVENNNNARSICDLFSSFNTTMYKRQELCRKKTKP